MQFKMTQNNSLKDLLAGAQLPALPQSAIRLLELAQDPENGPAEFAVPIEADPGLTGQVLRFVNSSYFGFSREISNVKLAITLVGIRTIKNFALWSAVFSLMPNPKSGPFDLKSLWQDSLRRGLFARAVGKHLGLKDAEDLFAAALLQDMAVPLLAKELGDKYRGLIEGRSEGQARISDLERQTFGWTHAEAGGVIARGWSLPESFAELIESHLDLEDYVESPDKEPGKVAVALSALLPATADESWNELDRFQAAYDKVMKGGPSVAETLEKVDKDYEEFAPVLKLSNPSITLVELLHRAEAKAAT
ncbi:HDOD domain-containing protein [Bremerella cremea]